MQVLLFNNSRAAVVLTLSRLSTLVGVLLLVSHSIIEVQAAATTTENEVIVRNRHSHNLRSTSRRYLDIEEDEAAAYPDLYSSSLDESKVTESNNVTNSSDDEEDINATMTNSDDEEDINDDELSTEEASNVTTASDDDSCLSIGK